MSVVKGRGDASPTSAKRGERRRACWSVTSDASGSATVAFALLAFEREACEEDF
jgi:hypothetical protein